MASTRDEITILTAVAATSSQTSATFVIPRAFEKFKLSIDVTVGSTLLIDARLDVFSPGANEWSILVDNLPSAAGITGVSFNPFIIGSPNTDSDVAALKLPIGGQLRVFMLHGNANEATYKVFVQPV